MTTLRCRLLCSAGSRRYAPCVPIFLYLVWRCRWRCAPAWEWIAYYEALRHRRRAQAILVVIACGLMLFEYWNGPFHGENTAVSPFYTQLATESGPSAVIDLPMGRQESKEYLYLQTIHHQPLVEGLSGRTPPDAYNYIDANSLLARLRNATVLDCQDVNDGELKQALDQLAADHFKYIIVHREYKDRALIFSDYLTTTPIYKDAAIIVYSIAGLQANPPCAHIDARRTSTPGG